MPRGSPGVSRRHSGSFKKGHSGQWPRPADADTRVVICARCQQPGLLSTFLDKANKQFKFCPPCKRAVSTARTRAYHERLKADPLLALAKLNRLAELQEAEAATIGSGYKNVDKWRYHIAKWSRQRSILLTVCGLQLKKGVRGHFEYQGRHGIIPADTVESRIREYYSRHPNERPTEGPDSLNGGN